ncbi:MAG: ABC transporter permease [Chitinophagaceae bacterium]|nr:ABC transporter permease [Chitinophagaceae bacterium]
MIKNYFKLAWRNIIKHPFYSTVNIAGLFAGITFVLLIGAYVWSELEVNKNLQHAKQQYFLESEWKGDQTNWTITTLAPVARRLKEDYPNLVANYYRWDGITSGVSKGDKNFREGIQLGDSTLLSMYGFELLQGNPATALKEPYSAVITEATAIKYFGKKNVVGESISIQSFNGGKRDFAITGVLKTIPKNSVTNLNDNNNNTIFIPTNTYAYFGRTDMENWSNTWTPSYIELKEGATLANVDKAIKRLMQTNAPDGIKANLTIHPVPLTEYYLKKDNWLVKRMLYALSFVALFILLMAVVNFINIAISSAGNRMREIGVRKVLGGLKKQLIIQFLSESLILVLIATSLALLAYPFARPVFADMVGKQLPSLTAFPLYFILLPPMLILAVGLRAGAYPAFVLSFINTVNSLKGKINTVKENIVLRKSLLGFQFAIAFIVLISAAIVTQQVTLFFSQNLGYNKEYMVSSQVPRDWSPEGVRKMKTIRDEFAAMPQVSNVTLSYEIPNGMNGGKPPVYRVGADSAAAIQMQALVTDENYLSTYQVPLTDGAFFDSRGLDSGKVILNEKAIKELGYTTASAAVGKQVRIPNDPTVYTIKGVVNDFHFGSMQENIQPAIFFNVNNAITYRYLSFRLKPGNVSASIEAIQKKWAQIMPGSSFEYSFMDGTLKKLYATELQLKKAAYAATILSLIIVLLGILGLISLSIHKRIKEIGIRKVLGASVQSIMLLFIKEFILIILAAALVAFPLAYLIMNKWLNNYAYHISISAQPFVLALLLLGAVTLLLIGLQTLKAAFANPVKALRTE